MIILILSLIFLSTPQVQSAEWMENIKEESSYYMSEKENLKTSTIIQSLGGPSTIKQKYQDIFNELDHKKIKCEWDLLTTVANNKESKSIEQELFVLRNTNVIDDIVLGTLLRANGDIGVKDRFKKVRKRSGKPGNGRPNIISNQIKSSEKDELKLFISENEELIIRSIEQLHKGQCLTQTWVNIVQSVAKVIEGPDSLQLRYFNDELFRSGIVDADIHKELELARKRNIHFWPINLKTYEQKRSFILNQDNDDEIYKFSDFVTNKDGKQRRSLRESLYSRYTPYQITLMASLIKDLKNRLDNVSDVKIQMMDADGNLVDEVLITSPSEQFRMYLRLLNIGRERLAANSFFKGKKPRHIDLITAAFELGVIPREELEHVAGLEEIWNPSKTRKEKIMYWLKTFGRVGVILVPPPYGFMATLALVALEASDINKQDESEFDHSLFLVE